jgi:UDP-glucose 4-epimerase
MPHLDFVMGMNRSKRKRAANSARRVAITGLYHGIGQRLLSLLERDNQVEHLLLLDPPPVPIQNKKTSLAAIDMTEPNSGTVLANWLLEHRVDTLVHMAFTFHPPSDAERAHEQNVIGTMNLLTAAATVGLQKVVMASSTLVYGATPDNPALIPEEQPLRPESLCRLAQDILDAEMQLAQFSDKHPDVATTVLRMASILAKNNKGFLANLLARQYVPKMIGFDPPMQFLDEEDAAEAIKICIDGDFPGIFNIASEGVLFYSNVLKLGGRIPLPVPPFFSSQLAGLLWESRLFDLPPDWMNYLKYGWVASREKASRELRFIPKHLAAETIFRFVQETRIRCSSSEVMF